MKTGQDTLKIRSFVEEKKPKTAVMVGGGFIGLEVAENLCDLGVKVTIVQRPKQLMNTLDYDMATLVHMLIITLFVIFFYKKYMNKYVFNKLYHHKDPHPRSDGHPAETVPSLLQWLPFRMKKQYIKTTACYN